MKHPAFQIGDTVGRLTVIKNLGLINKFQWYKCQCTCGAICVRRKDHLYNGVNRQSCGCWAKELARLRFLKHGHAGHNRSAEYDTWAHMIRRCHTPSTVGFENYGGRGIHVCDRLRYSFE